MIGHDVYHSLIPLGWRCPVCERVWAPDVKECRWCNRTQDPPLSNATIAVTIIGPKETK